MNEPSWSSTTRFPLDHPGGGRQRLRNPSHVEFDRTGAGHLPALVRLDHGHPEPILDLHVLLRVEALCQPLALDHHPSVLVLVLVHGPTIQTPPRGTASSSSSSSTAFAEWVRHSFARCSCWPHRKQDPLNPLFPNPFTPQLSPFCPLLADRPLPLRLSPGPLPNAVPPFPSFATDGHRRRSRSSQHPSGPSIIATLLDTTDRILAFTSS